MPGGAMPGAGRPKGSTGKRTQAVLDKLKEFNCDPIEGLIRVAQEAHQQGDLSLAGSTYKELAKYVAPQLKAIELSNEEGSGPLKIQWIS